MNNTVVLSSAYLAPVHYFTKITEAQVILIEQHENYLKQSYRNRCRIASANGVLPLTIPIVKEHGQKMLIRDVRIDYSEQWQHNHWKAIEAAYRSSPFFEYYADDFHPLYERKELFLFDWNDKLLRIVMELVGVKPAIRYTERYVNHYDVNDFRYTISPKSKQPDSRFSPCSYYQVFATINGFLSNLSILDLLCNEGPNSLTVLTAGVRKVYN